MDQRLLEKFNDIPLPKDLEEELKMAMPRRDDYVSLDTHPQLMKRVFAAIANQMEEGRLKESDRCGADVQGAGTK